MSLPSLAVGEPTQVMYDIIDAVEPHMPADKPRYLMGVGTPSNIMPDKLFSLSCSVTQRPSHRAVRSQEDFTYS